MIPRLNPPDATTPVRLSLFVAFCFALTCGAAAFGVDQNPKSAEPTPAPTPASLPPTPATASPAATPPATSDALTSTADVRKEPALPREIRNVRLTGVVTFVHADRSTFYLNDISGGISVELSDPRLPLPAVGDELKLTGTTAPGILFPMVRANSLELIRNTVLPPAREITFAQGMSGVEDGQWVEITGQLLRNEALGTWQRLTLATADGEFTVSIPSPRQHPSAPGANLRIRGVCAVWIQRGAKAIGGFFIFSPSLADARVITTAPGAHTPLIRIRQVQNLRSDEAHAGQPVFLRGVVTFVHPDQRLFYMSDSTGGVLVWPASPQEKLPAVGAAVSVTGVTSRGALTASVRGDRIDVTGTQAPPTPRSINLEQALTGSQDAQWVEIAGHLRQVDTSGDWLRMNLTAPAGEFTVSIPHASATDIKVGTYLLVKGICQTWLDDKRNIGGVFLYTPTIDDLKIAEAPPDDPFDVPEETIENLPLYRTQTLQRLQVKISGTVLHHVPGRYLVLENNSGVLRVLSRGEVPLAPGDHVDVAGIPGRQGNIPVLRGAIYRRTAAGDPPRALPLSDDWKADPAMESRLVSTTGRLLNSTTSPNDTRLRVQTEKHLLEVIHKGRWPAAAASSLEPGCTLKITGLYTVEFDENDEPARFTLLLRSPSDIEVIQSAPWWTLRRALTGLALIAACFLFGMTWIAALKRRVRRQTMVIRDQLQKEANLEDQHRQIVENASDFIFTTTPEGRFTSYNSAGERITGYPPAEAMKLSFHDLLAPEDAATRATLRTFAQTAATDREIHFESRFRTRTGATLWVETSLRQIHQAGKITGLLGISRNITERKQMEEQKRRLDELHRHIQKTESLGRMAAAIAHNFNNQVQGITMGLELTLTELPPDSDHARILGNSLAAAQKASQIGNLMLTYLGQAPGKTVRIDLTTTIRQGLTVLRPSLPSNIRLESQLAAASLSIDGHRELIEQVLPCLLTNAAEACEAAGGAVGVGLHAVAAKEIPPHNRFPVEFEPGAENYACVSVSDEGCGIPKENFEILFDPFFTTKFHGRGMGLAVIMGVARSHDGVVVVDSSVGKGSCFRLYLPLVS